MFCLCKAIILTLYTQQPVIIVPPPPMFPVLIMERMIIPNLVLPKEPKQTKQI